MSQKGSQVFQFVAIVNVGNKAIEVMDTGRTGNVFNSVLAADTPYSFDIPTPSGATFDHWLRGWGLANVASFPASLHQGYCGSGSC